MWYYKPPSSILWNFHFNYSCHEKSKLWQPVLVYMKYVGIPKPQPKSLMLVGKADTHTHTSAHAHTQVCIHTHTHLLGKQF